MSVVAWTVMLAAGGPTTRRVPQQFSSIQSAINVSKTGDTVLVDDGIYYENLRISKNIVLASRFIIDGDRSHIAQTILDGSRARDKLGASAVRIHGGTDTTCQVIGLTIRGGSGSHVTFPVDSPFVHWIAGGGILVLNSGARIAHNVITKNVTRPVGNILNTGGTGIMAYSLPTRAGTDTFVVIENNLVTENVATGRWVEVSGITVEQRGVVRHNTITHNQSVCRARAPGGGLGLYFNGQFDILVDGNYIRHNTSGIGAGILVGMETSLRGRAVIVNNIIADNEAFEVGGGVHVAENGYVILVNNTIVGNRAGSNGDGLHTASGGRAVLVNNIIWNNAPRPISAWPSVRSIHNLIEGGFPGINTLNADPQFVAGDSTFRLNPMSPAIGTGILETSVADESIDCPSGDRFGSTRPYPAMSNPDLGATESPLAVNNRTVAILDKWGRESDDRLKLTFIMHQTSPPLYSRDSTQVLRAGLMSTRLIVNDSTTHTLSDGSNEPRFSLTPGSNFLEVELITRGRTGTPLVNSVVRLEPMEPVSGTSVRNRGYAYRRHTDLPPGTYTLVVSTGDEGGLIDAVNMRSVQLVVRPFWYQRWWAYGMTGFLAAMAFLYVYSREVSRLRREKVLQQQFTKMQLEEQEAERKRLASELHDNLGQDLLVVNSELQQFIRDGSYSSEDVTRVAGIVQESINAVRDISSNLHPHHIERLGFCAAIEAMVEKVAHSSRLRIESACDPVDEYLTADARIHLYRIIQEALTNAVKHANATEVRLSVRRAEDAIEIRIADNGRGIKPAQDLSAEAGRAHPDIARGFGMKSMDERARIVGGKLEVLSEPQGGTTIRVTVPIAKRRV